MGNTGILTLILVLGCLETLAFSRQRRHYGNPIATVPTPYCGNVSYTERSRVGNSFPNTVTGKNCRNIESAITTILSLHKESSLCNYKIEAYSVEDCNDYISMMSSFNSDNKFVKLNDFSVCSFKVHHTPNPEDFFRLRFLEPTFEKNDKSQDVTSADCYNLCGQGSNFYPHTMRSNINGNDDRVYDGDVTLYSTPGCGDNDGPNTNSEIGRARHGANLMELINLVRPKIRSYMIVTD